MSRPLLLPLLSLALAGSVQPQAHSAGAGVTIQEAPGKLTIQINGKPFTEYHFSEQEPHVYYYPLHGPAGAAMTRNWPMKEVEGEEQDHPHHRSLWYCHGSVNGVDFWAETPKSGRIVHDKFLEVKGGKESGVVRSVNRWVNLAGEVVMTDERTFRVYNRPDTERLFDFEVTLKAGEKEVVLGDTKEGSMAIRINEALRLTHGKGKPGTGRIVLSTGVQDGETWGKAAAWCDYHGPLDGKVVGIALFDHPSNPRHPTWWHVRDYGLFAANPFGAHEFEKKPAGTGDLTIPAGKSLTFKYRFYLHEGDEKQAKVAERYDAYVRQH